MDTFNTSPNDESQLVRDIREAVRAGIDEPFTFLPPEEAKLYIPLWRKQIDGLAHYVAELVELHIISPDGVARLKDAIETRDSGGQAGEADDEED